MWATKSALEVPPDRTKIMLEEASTQLRAFVGDVIEVNVWGTVLSESDNNIIVQYIN